VKTLQAKNVEKRYDKTKVQERNKFNQQS